MASFCASWRPSGALRSPGVKAVRHIHRRSKEVLNFKRRTNELMWRHEMSGEHIGLRLHGASGQEPLHLPGGP
jgi:hypothetical protein